jgi:hypothetical protein
MLHLVVLFLFKIEIFWMTSLTTNDYRRSQSKGKISILNKNKFIVDWVFKWSENTEKNKLWQNSFSTIHRCIVYIITGIICIYILKICKLNCWTNVMLLKFEIRPRSASSRIIVRPVPEYGPPCPELWSALVLSALSHRPPRPTTERGCCSIRT